MHVLLIDGLNLIRRVYAGVPDDPEPTAHAQAVTRSVLGSLGRALDETAPSHAMLVLDSRGSSWRHDLYPAYKANRPAMPSPLADLLPDLIARINEFGIGGVHQSGYEADDVVATIARRVSASARCTILSTDKGFLPLMGDRIAIRHHFDHRWVSVDDVLARFGVPPERLPDWLALVGDTTLNIPGVPGIGPKTATGLLQNVGSVGDLARDASVPERWRARLNEHAGLVSLWRQLFTLRTDLQLGLNLRDYRLPN
ncbi:MAG: 5'-3' exonuclease H3TH domain-containing protein [Pseudomonadota bacterium]